MLFRSPAVTIREKKTFKFKGWLIIPSLFLAVAVIIGMLNYYSVISIDKFFAEVKYINMKSYYPLPTELRTLFGEYGDEEIKIKTSFYEPVMIDGEEYMVRNRRMEMEGDYINLVHFFKYDSNGYLFRYDSVVQTGEKYDADFEYGLREEAYLSMPHQLKLKKTCYYVEGNIEYEFTVLAFEDIVVDGKHYKNVLKLESIYFEDGIKISKEICYLAKHKGVIKLKTYAFEEGKWSKELDVELQH